MNPADRTRCEGLHYNDTFERRHRAVARSTRCFLT